MTVCEYEAMVRRYERLVYTVCYQLVRDGYAAEDLAQEAFLAAWLHRDECRPEAQKAWLCRIAANKSKDYLKSAAHRRLQVTEDDALCLFADEAPGPEQTAEARDSARQALEGIYAMNETYRDVCTAYFVNGCSAARIARQLDRPVRTVHTQLHRARQRLRARLATA